VVSNGVSNANRIRTVQHSISKVPQQTASRFIFSTTVMPHATASVNGVVVAETDSWEVVDGNIYVRLTTLHLQSVLTNTVSARHHQQIALQSHFHENSLSLQRRRELLHCDDQ
jgi:hypothetical protein